MNDAFIVSLLSAVPKNQVALAMGAGTRLRLPRWAHRLFIHWFANKYGVDLTECDRPLDQYPTFSEFFVRGLPAGARTIDPNPAVLVSPVDGRMHTQGVVSQGTFLQAKGQSASVSALLGEGDYEGWSYAVIYLAPHNYHRVHAPEAGVLKRLHYLPGKLWPVFRAATQSVPELFGRNERLNFWFEHGDAQLALSMVGAFGVGRITTPFAAIVTNTGTLAQDVPANRTIQRGDEIGQFELGSTVILVSRRAIDWSVACDTPVRLGQALGSWEGSSEANPGGAELKGDAPQNGP